MKIKSNTTNNDLPWRFGLYQRPSPGSCHGSDDVDWTFKKVKDQMMVKMTERKQKSEQKSRRPIVLPYVEGTSERVSRVMNKHQVSVTMRPVKTLRTLLVHPKTRERRNHGLCVQNSVQQLWENLHRWDWKKVWDKT